MNRPIRALIAQPGLDGHNRGAKTITLGLRDEGMEVIYTGIRETPERTVRTCIQEDIDSGIEFAFRSAYVLFPGVAGLLAEKGVNRVLVIGGYWTL